jgi:hypothetical protein
MYWMRFLPLRPRPDGRPTYTTEPRRRRRLLAALAALAASGGVAASTDHVDAHDDEDDDGPGRRNITITATAGGLTVPDQVPAGLVDITLDTAGADDGVGHHLVIARLDDGVSLDEFLAAGDAGFFTMIDVKGGNGTIAAGESLDMTLDLDPGNYFVLDNPQLPNPVIERFTVVESQAYADAPEPEAEGTIRIGPNMLIAVPEHFDGTGVWEFVNDDPALIHEAAMVRLAAGKTIDDVIAWGHGGFAGEVPFDGEFGSMGALGPGERAWTTLVPPGPGEYALICFVPDEGGMPHLGAGMVVPFTVEA